MKKSGKIISNHLGFTLVEILIVVVIIGILAAALIPRLLGAQSMTRDVARVKNISEISQELEIYHGNIGNYINLGGQGGCTDVAEFSNQLKQQNIISHIPNDPQKQHINYGNRIDKGLCKGTYSYVGLYDKHKDAMGPTSNPNSFVLSFSPENFSKGNIVLPFDAFAKQEGVAFPYSYDWQLSRDLYTSLICQNKKGILIDKNIDSSIQNCLNLGTSGGGRLTKSIIECIEKIPNYQEVICKTDNPQRVTNSTFSMN